jgi:hypothetical protein
MSKVIKAGPSKFIVDKGGIECSCGECSTCTAGTGLFIRDEDTLDRAIDDPVETPSHYTRGDVECIDAVRAALGEERFRGWCQGGAIKYLWRYEHKGRPAEDLRKARRFIDILLADMGEDE